MSDLILQHIHFHYTFYERKEERSIVSDLNTSSTCNIWTSARFCIISWTCVVLFWRLSQKFILNLEYNARLFMNLRPVSVYSPSHAWTKSLSHFSLPLWISITSQLPLGSHRCRQYAKIITEHQQNKFNSGVFMCISAWGFILSNMLLFIHTFAWKTRTHPHTHALSY